VQNDTFRLLNRFSVLSLLIHERSLSWQNACIPRLVVRRERLRSKPHDRRLDSHFLCVGRHSVRQDNAFISSVIFLRISSSNPDLASLAFRSCAGATRLIELRGMFTDSWSCSPDFIFGFS
jgi:hypothetical protein